jgi:hypothetical protein
MQPQVHKIPLQFIPQPPILQIDQVTKRINQILALILRLLRIRIRISLPIRIPIYNIHNPKQHDIDTEASQRDSDTGLVRPRLVT